MSTLMPDSITDRFFYHLQGEFLDTASLFALYSKTTSIHWQQAYMFEICKVPVELVSWKTNWIQVFLDNFSCDINFLKIQSGMFYPWHKDIPRKVCVNVVLKGHDSLVIFRDSAVQTDTPYAVHELNYNSQAVLLNINEEHCVITRQQPRVVMTLSFYDTVYKDVYDFCVKNNL